MRTQPGHNANFTSAAQEVIIAHSSLKLAGTPEDIAGAVKFLVFDAPYITGQIFAVDGGRSVNI